TAPPSSPPLTLFPYTTLFRSRLHRPDRLAVDTRREQAGAEQPVGLLGGLAERELLDHDAEGVGDVLVESAGLASWSSSSRSARRSEEHTSELQSLRHLVCRLL